MSIPVSDWADMMPFTVSIEPWTGADAFGVPTYGAAVNYPAQIEGKIRMVRNMSGEEQVSSVTVYIGGTPGVKAEDRITLPAPYSPTQPSIIGISKVPDESGPHHEVVYTA